MILLSADIDRHIEKFISKERPLREYVKEIDRMKNMASEIASLPVYVPMHFFLLDCTGINSVSLNSHSSKLVVLQNLNWTFK